MRKPREYQIKNKYEKERIRVYCAVDDCSKYMLIDVEFGMDYELSARGARALAKRLLEMACWLEE